MRRFRLPLGAACLFVLMVIASPPLARADDDLEETLRRIDHATKHATTSDGLIEALRPFLRSHADQRFACHVAYARLIDHFRKRDLAPLARAFETARSADFRLWLASVGDYCGDRAFFGRLTVDLAEIRDPLDRARTAIAVAFKTGNPAVVPALIEALGRSETLLGRTTVDLAAEYALLVVTNHFARPDHPATLWNYQCFVMPPPVDPFPAPADHEGPIPPETRAKIQRFWRAWWQANRKRKQVEWIRDGIDRDVELLRSGGLSARIRNALEARLRLFVRAHDKRDLAKEWPAERARYRPPKRAAR